MYRETLAAKAAGIADLRARAISRNLVGGQRSAWRTTSLNKGVPERRLVLGAIVRLPLLHHHTTCLLDARHHDSVSHISIHLPPHPIDLIEHDHGVRA